MCPESWAPSLQRGVGCKLLAERAPACRLCCHWSPHRDLQQGEEPGHQSSTSQTIHNQQAARRGFLQVPQIFEDPERLIPESHFGEPVSFWALILSVQHLWLCLHQPQCGAVEWRNRGQPVELLQRRWWTPCAFCKFYTGPPQEPSGRLWWVCRRCSSSLASLARNPALRHACWSLEVKVIASNMNFHPD